ncbi:MAG: NAD(P)H-hydrate dehydratase [Clostridiales Family XIII bacterium]|nr:NAD(P)H-hydrate dehydratase [Clostridiales Family XIII bacterium]
METITYKQIRELFLTRRPRDAHKGDFGHVLVVAGSKGMAGAAVLCARGALRAGAGLVTVSAPDELFAIIQTAVPEAMCIGRSLETDLSESALRRYDAVALGPGIGTTAKSYELVSWLLQKYTGQFVIDADALNIVAVASRSDKQWFAGFPTVPPQSIVTPHPGEAARLLGVSSETVIGNRAGALAALKAQLGCVVCLKGAGTLVSMPVTLSAEFKFDSAPQNPDPEGPKATDGYINTTGNPGMATGGAGDVLTGVIASLLAQGMPLETAARAGVYIHGLAGDLAASERGEHGLTAGDIAEYVAYAIKKLVNESIL